MYLKNLLLICMAMVVALSVSVACPAFGGKLYTPEELREWEAKLNERDRTAEAEYKSNGKFYHSTVEFDRKFREWANAERADIVRQRAELEAAWQQYYAAQTPPAGEFAPAPLPVPEAALTPRRYYYWDGYSQRYFGVYVDCYPGWGPPIGWGWSLWTPYCGIPIYGWVDAGWRGNQLVVNNVVAGRGFNQAGFHQRFQERFAGGFSEPGDRSVHGRMPSEIGRGNFNTPHANAGMAQPQREFQRRGNVPAAPSQYPSRLQAGQMTNQPTHQQYNTRRAPAPQPQMAPRYAQPRAAYQQPRRAQQYGYR